MTTDEKYMRRCLQLARNGRQNAKPNPMVGAVIVSSDGRIIGEGYHVRCGKAHAEVNAFASVHQEDEPLLKEATLYVSLEPLLALRQDAPLCRPDCGERCKARSGRLCRCLRRGARTWHQEVAGGRHRGNGGCARSRMPGAEPLFLHLSP